MSTSGAKRPAYHHGELRAALVAAGLAILEETGDPAALGLREAARRAGVSAMAPYRHFTDKDALLAAVATVGFERFHAALKAADAGAQGRDALIGQGGAYVAFACANPALFRLMFGPCRAPRPEPLMTAAGAAYAVLSRRVAALLPDDVAQDSALRYWALVHGIAALAIDGLVGDPAGIPALTERLLRLELALPAS